MIPLTQTIQRLDTQSFSLYFRGHASIKSTEFTAADLRAIADDIEGRAVSPAPSSAQLDSADLHPTQPGRAVSPQTAALNV